MPLTDNMSIIAIAGAVTVIFGAIYSVQKVLRGIRKDKKEYAAEILQEAKEEISLAKTQLEAKISALRTDLKNLEHNVGKDMDHIKETYNGEIRNLGDKIEGLRNELRDQHGNLVQLLSKLIENRD